LNAIGLIAEGLDDRRLTEYGTRRLEYATTPQFSCTSEKILNARGSGIRDFTALYRLGYSGLGRLGKIFLPSFPFVIPLRTPKLQTWQIPDVFT
jgi:hypothetical protein